MKFIPTNKALKKYIDHYWIVKDSEKLFKNKSRILAFPGIRPELIIVLDGSLNFTYNGQNKSSNESILENHIKINFTLNPKDLKSFVFVQFKARSLSALMPFLDIPAPELIKLDLSNANTIFGERFVKLTTHLKKLSPIEIANELDEWFYSRMDKDHFGFVTEFFSHMGSSHTLKEIKEHTSYSYSTIERYFKKETGMTPKHFQSLKRYKSAVEEMYDTQNNDWFHYINKYGYYDQSHFIKEIKKFTSFTPEQLLKVSGLRSYRPI